MMVFKKRKAENLMKSKSVLIGTTICIIFAVTGIAACDTISDLFPTSIKSMGAAEVVEAYYSAIYENRFDDALEYVDEISLYLFSEAVIPIEDYRRRITDMHFDDDISLRNILVESIDYTDRFEELRQKTRLDDNIEYEGFRVRVRLDKNGENTTIDEPDTYVVKRNDGYRILLGNILEPSESISRVTYAIDNDQLRIATTYLCLVNGFVVVIDYENESNVDFQLGWVDPGKVLLETDISIYSVPFPFGTRILAYTTDRIVIWVDDAFGDIQRISITNVIELSPRGLPVYAGDSGDTFLLWDSDDDSSVDEESNPVIEMPDLKGQYLGDAIEQLQELCADLNIITEEIVDDEDVGIVIETVPPSGTVLVSGDTIIIRCSSGQDLTDNPVSDDTESDDSTTGSNLGSFSNKTFEIIVTGLSQSGSLVSIDFEIHNKSSRDIQLFGFPSIVVDGRATQAHFFDNVQAEHARTLPPDSYGEYTLNFATDIKDSQSVRLQGVMFSMGNFGDLSFNVDVAV